MIKKYINPLVCLNSNIYNADGKVNNLFLHCWKTTREIFNLFQNKLIANEFIGKYYIDYTAVMNNVRQEGEVPRPKTGATIYHVIVQSGLCRTIKG